MKGYIQVPQNNQPLQTFLFFQIVNLALVIIGLVELVTILLDTYDPPTMFIILTIYSFFMIPSILFQLYPKIRENLTFRSVASMISVIMIVVWIINFFAMINATDFTTMIIFYGFLLVFTGPGAIISASLLLLLAFGIHQPEPRLMMVPQEFQSIQTPMV